MAEGNFAVFAGPYDPSGQLGHDYERTFHTGPLAIAHAEEIDAKDEYSNVWVYNIRTEKIIWPES